MIKNSIIYYSSACGFDLASRPHSLTRYGSICFLKGDSPCAVSSFVHHPSFFTYGETDPCMAVYTYQLTHPLVKPISGLDQDGVQHLHFSLKGKNLSFYAQIYVLSLFFASCAPSLGWLSLSSLQIQMQFLNFKVISSVACCGSSNQLGKQLCALSGCCNINLWGDNS